MASRATEGMEAEALFKIFIQIFRIFDYLFGHQIRTECTEKANAVRRAVEGVLLRAMSADKHHRITYI